VIVGAGDTLWAFVMNERPAAGNKRSAAPAGIDAVGD
jgi:hypothetical protein